MNFRTYMNLVQTLQSLITITSVLVAHRERHGVAHNSLHRNRSFRNATLSAIIHSTLSPPHSPPCRAVPLPACIQITDLQAALLGGTQHCDCALMPIRSHSVVIHFNGSVVNSLSDRRRVDHKAVGVNKTQARAQDDT